MGIANTKILTVIENAFTKAITVLKHRDQHQPTSDLFVQVEPESGELQVYDEAEELLSKVVIFDWIKKEYNEDAFNTEVAEVLKSVLTTLDVKEAFDADCFQKPLSVSLVDDSFTVLEELLFIADDVFRLDDPLLKDLDADLDDFLDKLLSDVD